MKMYILDNGRLYLDDKEHITPGRGGVPISMPVPMFLFDHPEGLVVFDTGVNVANWPVAMQKDAVSAPEQRIDKQLIALGYNPENVKYVIMSHLHFDHAGQMTLFPQATFIVRQKELTAAWWHEGFMGYIFADYKDTRDYKYIQPLDNEDYDVFGDGRLICIDTKGHTRGHQSLIVNLPKSGSFVLAADAAHLAENYMDRLPPCKDIWSSEHALKVYTKFKKLEEEGAFLLFGHDIELWKALRIAPDYYE